MTRYELFDRNRILLRDIALRGHDLAWADCSKLAPPEKPYEHPEFDELVARIAAARREGGQVVLMMGGHPIKLGLSRFLVDLVRRGIVTHVATSGAGVIHDFELALVGGTSENVGKWVKAGQFGLWEQTSRINAIISEAADRREGLGEAMGRVIEEQAFPHRELSVAAACFRAGIPFTAHVSVGSDITHSMANCDGAALGETSYTDFLIFARTIEQLEGGVFLNVGTAVTGPEVYLKALSMARNVAAQLGRRIEGFATAVFDLVPLPADFRGGPPSKDDPVYYFRPWKTILCRTVEDGGFSYYFCGDHRRTIPTLWHRVVALCETPSGSFPDGAS